MTTSREELAWCLQEYGWHLVHYQVAGEIPGSHYGGEPVEVRGSFRATKDSADQMARTPEKLLERVRAWERRNAGRRPEAMATPIARGMTTTEALGAVRVGAGVPASMDAPSGEGFEPARPSQPRDAKGRFASKGE